MKKLFFLFFLVFSKLYSMDFSPQVTLPSMHRLTLTRTFNDVIHKIEERRDIQEIEQLLDMVISKINVIKCNISNFDLHVKTDINDAFDIINQQILRSKSKLAISYFESYFELRSAIISLDRLFKVLRDNPIEASWQNIIKKIAYHKLSDDKTDNNFDQLLKKINVNINLERSRICRFGGRIKNDLKDLSFGTASVICNLYATLGLGLGGLSEYIGTSLDQFTINDSVYKNLTFAINPGASLADIKKFEALCKSDDIVSRAARRGCLYMGKFTQEQVNDMKKALESSWLLTPYQKVAITQRALTLCRLQDCKKEICDYLIEHKDDITTQTNRITGALGKIFSLSGKMFKKFGNLAKDLSDSAWSKTTLDVEDDEYDELQESLDRTKDSELRYLDLLGQQYDIRPRQLIGMTLKGSFGLNQSAFLNGLLLSQRLAEDHSEVSICK